MDSTVISVTSQEWLSNTVLPILAVVVPVWVYLSTPQTSVLKSKVDITTYKTEIDALKKDITETRDSALLLRKEIKDDLNYIRQRLDSVSDFKKRGG